MSHMMPAVPPVLPRMHYQPVRRANGSYMSPPLPIPPGHVPIANHPPPHHHYQHQNHHHHHPPHYQQAQSYRPGHYRAHQMYQPQPTPATYPPYTQAPLVVSSYPHSQPPLPRLYHPSPSAEPVHPPPHATQSTIHAVHGQRSPPSSTTSSTVATPALTASTVSPRRETPPPILSRESFCPPLPWYSVPEQPFPPRATRRRRPRRVPEPAASSLELPHQRRPRPDETATSLATISQTSIAHTVSESETPVTSNPSSEADSTHPSTPSSALPRSPVRAHPATPHHASSPSRTIVPVIPLAPALPRPSQAPTSNARPRSDRIGVTAPVETMDGTTSVKSSSDDVTTDEPIATPPGSTVVAITTTTPSADHGTAAPVPPSPQATVAAPPPPRRSWADMVRSNVPKGDGPGRMTTSTTSSIAADGTEHGPPAASSSSSSSSLAQALSSFGVDAHSIQLRKLAFLEPRGLVNTGNMCYMNSILQVLMFCHPFYGFLDQMAKRSTHSFKDETPLLDVMVMFMHEFRVVDSAVSEDRLRVRLKAAELEQRGEAFIPDFVYDVIRRLPRFASMRRGHQQDAQEFLGFLLEGLHDECVRVMKDGGRQTTESEASTSARWSPPVSSPVDPRRGWLEVGPKQKAAVTRASGAITIESPITRIFGGKLRSELRVPGLKNSVTLEPYQPLQLDIQSPNVHDVMDALRGLTRPESLHGNFNSPRGPDITATKQIFIESLPPVLILHLKRFQYDNHGGTQKIWKKIGYPLDLELPREVFPPHQRNARLMPEARYRLVSVVYHHGKNAGGGHYTVDVRRQDGREWIRLDDINIRRVRKEEVAEAAGEEDSKVWAAVAESHGKDVRVDGNVFDPIANPDGGADHRAGWRQVNGNRAEHGRSKRTPSPETVDGTTTGQPHRHEPSSDGKHSIRDNKVAYLLFYQRISFLGEGS